MVGYFEKGRVKYQIVDTPGLLDRPFEERNVIEKKAILALSLLTDLCIFIIDPTGHCGYAVDPQLKLLGSLFRSLPDMRFIVCIGKTDLPLPEGSDLSGIDRLVEEHEDRVLEYLTISGETQEGIPEVLAAVVENLKVVEETPWADPPSVE
jgi:nucleolar GTP-binding protein